MRIYKEIRNLIKEKFKSIESISFLNRIVILKIFDPFFYFNIKRIHINKFLENSIKSYFRYGVDKIIYFINLSYFDEFPTFV